MIPNLLFQPGLVPTEPDPEKLRAAVSVAVAFEHAIIPPYLYALYSLDSESNAEIAALLRSVVRDEMLHLLLACNLLNALGGSPDLQSRDFIPRYPGPLPGTLPGRLEVGLAPFSLELVKSVFMEIEAPDEPLEFQTKLLALDGGGASYTTVGQFYRAIRDQIKARGNELIVGSPLLQATDPRMPELIGIFDAATASAAIEIIVEQGEGTRTDPASPEGDYAHYYKFAEMVKLRRLVPNPDAGKGAPPDQRHEYGAPIPFHPTGVWQVPRNPNAVTYGPKALRACQIFNYTYTSLLHTLHGVVNGRPQELTASLGLMFSLKHQALGMMSGRSTDGIPTGPTFEYQATMPA